MTDADIIAQLSNMNPTAQRAAALALELEQYLERLRSESNTDLKSRELSLAITNIETGSLWLGALIARLDTEPQS